MRRKKVLVIVIAVLLCVSVALALFHSTRPSVAFITSGSFPRGYDLPEPRSFFSFRRTSDASSADLVIVPPDAEVPSSGGYLFGREAEEGENPSAVLGIDNGRMWAEAIDEGRYAAVFEESSLLASSIMEVLEPLGVVPIPYMGRISSANIDSVRREIASAEADTVLLLTPSTSMSLIRSDHEWSVIMDIRDAAAMDTTEVDAAVSIDWNRTVQDLLSGVEELSYCVLPL